MTCGGTPSIYAGDEQAFRGIKEHRPGGDDAIRPAFPAAPADLAPFGWPTYRLHQDLIGMRRRHPWLHHARTRVVDLTNTHFVYEAFHGDHRLLVALNLTDAPVTRSIPYLGDIVAGNAAYHHTGASQAQMTLPPHGWAILG
jgi:glycosidase